MTKMKNTVRISYDASFDENQKNLCLDNARVQWVGESVLLWSQDMKRNLAWFTANEVVEKIKRWCVKNNYRCTQIVNGKVQL